MELEVIQNKIYELRGLRVLLDFDLATMYSIETRVLKQSVRRNIKRFPSDFFFELNESEINLMVSQNVIPSKSKFGGAFPFAFTEQGVAMLSSVLSSSRAIEVNIAIMRAFVLMRQYAFAHNDLSHQLEVLEKKYDQQFSDIYQALNYLIQKDQQSIIQTERNPIGYKLENE